MKTTHSPLPESEQDYEGLPLVTTLAKEEIEAAVAAVREALSEEEPEDAEAWMSELCGESFSSNLFFCDWAAVCEKLR